MSYAIQTENITKYLVPFNHLTDVILRPFQKTAPIIAVDRVSLRVNPSEIFGILGPNGAGKTTLMKMLCTLITPTSGRAMVSGYDITKAQHKVKSCVGVVSCAERDFYWRLTGRQNLEFYGVLYNLKASEIRSRLQHFSQLLELDMGQRFDTYSTGTKQKMALARALMHNPAVILMDEPTRSLDPVTAARFRHFIKKELSEKQGRTIVLVTHQLQEAEELCDRIAIMNRGRLLVSGTLEEIHLKAGLLTEKGARAKHSLDQLFTALFS